VAEQLAFEQAFGNPAQLMATNGLSARRLWEWMLRATSSLPVPLSPRISTVESVGAIFRTSPRIERSAGDGATMSGTRFAPRGC
jgi:hypothetical protein